MIFILVQTPLFHHRPALWVAPQENTNSLILVVASPLFKPSKI